MDRRIYPRKLLDPIHVSDIQSVNRLMFLARRGTILNASATGLLIGVGRRDLCPEMLRRQPTLEGIEGEHVMMTIVEMDLQIDGEIQRARPTEPGDFELAVDFTDHAPIYWRECLAELLPGPGEIHQAESS